MKGMYKVVLKGLVSEATRVAYFDWYSDATDFVEAMSNRWNVEVVSGMVPVIEEAW